MPVGKGNPAVPPILLAKMSLGQEIELVCKAYKVGFFFCLLRCKGPSDLSRA